MQGNGRQGLRLIGFIREKPGTFAAAHGSYAVGGCGSGRPPVQRLLPGRYTL